MLGVGSRILSGVRFQVYSGDHDGAATPNVHACFPEGDVVIEIYRDKSVAVSTAHKDQSIRASKKPQIKRALKVAAASIEPLLALCGESNLVKSEAYIRTTDAQLDVAIKRASANKKATRILEAHFDRASDAVVVRAHDKSDGNCTA